ncbi:hypothetical protein [Sebaldella sp. S0638]|nr:hypothetical protein [Sebaldella sp. S0638]MCP1225441.1 hypothetical protein [Sebaldella sp. S0638]
MEFYKRLIIKILDRSSLGHESLLLKKLKSGHDLNQIEMQELEELIDQII